MTRQQSAFSAAELLDLLPHRHPFNMIDRIDSMIAGESATATKCISISDSVFSGHFPGRPIYPGVLLVESIAQVCGVVLATAEATPRIGYLASIKRFKFSRLVEPGDRLTISVKKKIVFGALTEFSAEITTGTVVVASGVLAIALADPDSP